MSQHPESSIHFALKATNSAPLFWTDSQSKASALRGVGTFAKKICVNIFAEVRIPQSLPPQKKRDPFPEPSVLPDGWTLTRAATKFVDSLELNPNSPRTRLQGFPHWVTRGRFWADVKNSTIAF